MKSNITEFDKQKIIRMNEEMIKFIDFLKTNLSNEQKHSLLLVENLQKILNQKCIICDKTLNLIKNSYNFLPSSQKYIQEEFKKLMKSFE